MNRWAALVLATTLLALMLATLRVPVVPADGPSSIWPDPTRAVYGWIWAPEDTDRGVACPLPAPDPSLDGATAMRVGLPARLDWPTLLATLIAIAAVGGLASIAVQRRPPSPSSARAPAVGALVVMAILGTALLLAVPRRPWVRYRQPRSTWWPKPPGGLEFQPVWVPVHTGERVSLGTSRVWVWCVDWPVLGAGLAGIAVLGAGLAAWSVRRALLRDPAAATRATSAVLAGTWLALLAATLVMPVHDWVSWDAGPREPVPWWPADTRWAWVGRLFEPPTRVRFEGSSVIGEWAEHGWSRARPVWPLLLGTEGLVLALGASLLAVFRRRARRAGGDAAPATVETPPAPPGPA